MCNAKPRKASRAKVIYWKRIVGWVEIIKVFSPETVVSVVVAVIEDTRSGWLLVVKETLPGDG